MNINFNDAKQHFIDKGYCSFNLYEFDSEFFEFLNNFLACNEEKNLTELFIKGRFDSETFKTRIDCESFEKAENYKKSLFEEHDFIDKKYNHDNISQCWYYTEIENVEKFLKKNQEYKIQNLRQYLNKKVYSIMKYFYELPENAKFNTNESNFTFYNKDCRFTQHQDGVGVNYCSMIIYLNKDYNQNDGGLLLLDDEYVIPEIGTVALMDLSKHNVRHGVSKVTGGPGRFALLYFPILQKD